MGLISFRREREMRLFKQLVCLIIAITMLITLIVPVNGAVAGPDPAAMKLDEESDRTI